MRDKLKDWLVQFEGVGSNTQAGLPVEPQLDVVADAEGALIALGYKPQDAAKMVAAVNGDDVVDSEDLIRRALKSMVSA